MKKFLFLSLVVFTWNIFAVEAIYNCPTLGAKLIKQNAYSFELKTLFRSVSCDMGTTNFPGTEIDMRQLTCGSTKYYFTEIDENTVVLSKNLVWSKDYYCQKI